MFEKELLLFELQIINDIFMLFFLYQAKVVAGGIYKLSVVLD